MYKYTRKAKSDTGTSISISFRLNIWVVFTAVKRALLVIYALSSE
jgi:hypothetical protein